MSTNTQESSDEVRKFINELALQLQSSNDTMYAIRLFRKELPIFLAQRETALRLEIEGEIKSLHEDEELCQGEYDCANIVLNTIARIFDAKQHDNGTK